MPTPNLEGQGAVLPDPSPTNLQTYKPTPADTALRIIRTHKPVSGAEWKNIFSHSALEEGLYFKPKYRAILFIIILLP